jgi:hypothetical protein
MTTNKSVVVDGKSEAEVRGLVQIKANELVRRLLQGSLNLDWVLKRTQDVIEGPDGFETMIHIPLVWSADLGPVRIGEIEERIHEVNKATNGTWRRPTERELSRAMKGGKVSGFMVGIRYWTSTPHFDGRGFTVFYNHGQGFGACSHLDCSIDPVLRLCRPLDLSQCSY